MTDFPETIARMFDGQFMALSRVGGDALLGVEMPEGMRASTASATVTLERGERFVLARGLAVVPVRGVLTPNMFGLERWMGWATYQGIADTCAELEAHEDVRGVVLDMDTPGGMVLGIQEAGDAIAELAKAKPVHAFVNPMAASAGYWLASQASEVVMTPGSVVGSIGVRLTAYAPVQPDNWGDQWFELSSSHARAKNPDPTTEAGLTEFRRSLDESERSFFAAVSEGRGISAGELPAALSVTGDPQDGGAVFEPADAISRGLADSLETRAGFYARVQASYAPPQQAPSALRGQSALAVAAAARASASI